jgi:hypothetical protein
MCSPPLWIEGERLFDKQPKKVYKKRQGRWMKIFSGLLVGCAESTQHAIMLSGGC